MGEPSSLIRGYYGLCGFLRRLRFTFRSVLDSVRTVRICVLDSGLDSVPDFFPDSVPDFATPICAGVPTAVADSDPHSAPKTLTRLNPELGNTVATVSSPVFSLRGDSSRNPYVLPVVLSEDIRGANDTTETSTRDGQTVAVVCVAAAGHRTCRYAQLGTAANWCRKAGQAESGEKELETNVG